MSRIIEGEQSAALKELQAPLEEIVTCVLALEDENTQLKKHLDRFERLIRRYRENLTAFPLPRMNQDIENEIGMLLDDLTRASFRSPRGTPTSSWAVSAERNRVDEEN